MDPYRTIPDDERWLEIALDIADGSPIDWNAVARDASAVPGPPSLSLVMRLQTLERLVRGHQTIRTNASGVEDVRDTILTETSRKATRCGNAIQVRWGPLVIIEKIGRGSFGDVYRAWDPRLDREVALKLIPENASGADAASPVVQEGRLLARVRHPNVLTVYGAERIDGRVGIWTELIEGDTLAAEVSRRGPLDPVEAARIGIDVCRALEAVHRAGLLHRDVKAQNILRDPGGRPVLGDFGTGIDINEQAAVTEPQIAGTPLYLAPEVINHQPPSIGSDLYSVGVLLYFLVTGTYPVRGRTLVEIRQEHAAGKSIPLRTQRAGVPEEFADVVDGLLTDDPHRRYGSAAAVTAALETCVLTSAGAVVTQRRMMRRWRWPTGVALLLASAAVAAIADWQARTPPPVIPAVDSTVPKPAASSTGVAASETAADVIESPAPAASAAAVPALNAGDWIVVADFVNATGDDALDMIEVAFKRELEYSDYLRVAQASRIDDSLRLLGRPLDSRLDAALARQVALQDPGVRAFVTGRVDRDDQAFAVSVDVVNPVDGASIGQLREPVRTASDVTAAVRRAAFAIRERVGEPPDSVNRSRQALQRSSPPSLPALQLYGQAKAKAHSFSILPPTRVPYQGPEWSVVERLARGAVDADQRLGGAWVLLSRAIGGQPGKLDQARAIERTAYVEKASGFIDDATPRERYAIEAMLHGHRAYQHRVQGNPFAARRELESWVTAIQALLALHPDDDEVSEAALQEMNERLGPEFDREIRLMTIQAADARPKNVALNLEVAKFHLSERRFDAARRYAARAEGAMAASTPAEGAMIHLFPASIAWLQDDPRAVLQIVERVARTAVSIGDAERREIYTRLVPIYFALGRTRQAAEILDDVPAGRAEFFSNVGDKARLQQLVATWPESAPPGNGIALMNRIGFFIETGKLEAAERELVTLELVTTTQGSAGFRSVYLDYQGAFELARGRPERAIELLRQSIDIKAERLPGLASINGHYTISQLAMALETTGRLDEAIALLAGAGDRRNEVAASLAILDTWTLNRAHLARLYRKNGQVADAKAVEAQLLNLLAHADRDFPLLQELRNR